MPEAQKIEPQVGNKTEEKEPSVKRTNFSKLYPDDQPVMLLVKENPKKKGSKSHARFQSYFGADTIGAAREGDNGVSYQDIVYDIGHEFIRVG